MANGETRPKHGNDPLRQMAQCHEKIAGHLDRLGVLAAAGEGATGEMEAALPSIVRWFETNGHRHRIDEEQSLFPRLAACGAGDPEITAALRALAAEHGEEDALVAELAAVARALPGGGLAGKLAREAARRFVAHFRRHMDIEDRVVLPRAARELGAADLEVIAAEMESRRADASCS